MPRKAYGQSHQRCTPSQENSGYYSLPLGAVLTLPHNVYFKVCVVFIATATPGALSAAVDSAIAATVVQGLFLGAAGCQIDR